MEAWIKQISDMIIQDRTWSWSVIGFLYLLLTLIVRNWFLSPFIKRAKELKHRWYQDIKDLYLKSALTGWIFYLISFVIVILIWIRPQFLPLSLFHRAALAVAVLSYFLSIILHLQALGVASVVILRRIESK